MREEVLGIYVEKLSFSFQRTDYGCSQSVQEVVLMGKWLLVHAHFTLLLQLTVICSSLVGGLVVKGWCLLFAFVYI